MYVHVVSGSIYASTPRLNQLTQRCLFSHIPREDYKRNTLVSGRRLVASPKRYPRRSLSYNRGTFDIEAFSSGVG